MEASEPADSTVCALCGGAEQRERFEKHGRRFVECRDCGLVWIRPMPTQAELDAYYGAAYSGGRYSTFTEAEEIRSLISRHRVERVRGVSRSGRWLDVGCSTGAFVAAAVASGIEAEGLDISRGAVEQARARGLTAHHSRVEDFAPESRYDTITAFDLLEHLLDPRAFIVRLREWLVPGGSLVLTLPDVRSVYPRLLMRKHWFYYWPDEHLYYFDRNTIARLLGEEGFEVSHVGRAYKPLSLQYSARNLQAFNATLGRVSRLVIDALPERLARRPWKLYVGEMLVVARQAG